MPYFTFRKCKKLFLLLSVCYFPADKIGAQSWVTSIVPTPHPVISIEAVDENVVWACGWEGAYLRTTDGGENWTAGQVSGTESFDFFSIAAIDANTAYLSGTGYQTVDTRIYKTSDGGQSWEMQYRNTQPDAFINSIAFWDESNGIAVSDAVDGSFLILTTSNGGVDWEPVPAENIPSPLPGEYGGAGYPAGTSVAVYGEGLAWFGTAYGMNTSDPVRIFKSTDWGQTWGAVETPLTGSDEFKGIATLSFLDSLNGVAGGFNGLIQSTDGGQSWLPVNSFVYPNATISGIEYVPETGGQAIVVATTEGTAYSTDGGASWMGLSNDDDFFGLSFVNSTTGWAAAGWQQGQGGLISRFEGNLLTAVVEQRPDGFLNSYSFPNPFTTSTTISFYLPSPQPVLLKIYNASGKEVAVLADEQMAAGEHQVIFDRHGLAPGIYFYQLQAGINLETGKLSLGLRRK